MSDGRRRRFTPVGDLVDGLLSDAMPDDPGFREQLATGAFRAVVGPAVAGHCRVLCLRGRTLAVAVSSKRWHGELQRMGPDILVRVNEALPPPVRLSAIEFRLQA